jgi:hypothetical protein
VEAREIARILGQRGGRARAARLGEAERKRIASLGGQARRQSLDTARRIVQNLEYAAAVAELRTVPRKVTRLRTFKERLPGIYPRKS